MKRGVERIVVVMGLGTRMLDSYLKPILSTWSVALIPHQPDFPGKVKRHTSCVNAHAQRLLLVEMSIQHSCP